MAPSNLEDLRDRRMWVGCLAEFLGTMLLVTVACGSAVLPSATVVQISLCFGFSVASIVWAIGHVSGGHINPAVTIGFLVARRMTLIRALLYIGFQVAGAIVGALLLRAITPAAATNNLGAVGLSTALTPAQGLGIECIECFILVFVVFAAVDANRTDLGGSVPLTVGVAIAMNHLWAVRLTGSGMNPARSLGPAVVNSNYQNQWFVYWLGPLAGGAIAALVYELVFAANATRDKAGDFFTLDYDHENYGPHGVRDPEREKLDP